MPPSDEKSEKERQENLTEPAFTVAELVSPPKRPNWKILLPVWAVLISLIMAGYHYRWEPRIVGGSVVLLAISSNAIAGLVATIGLVPFIGPLLVKVLALPVVWLLNSMGYLVSFVAVRRGHSREVLISRGLTIALIIGIVIGYVIGKFI